MAEKIFSRFRQLSGSLDRFLAFTASGNAPDGPSKNTVKCSTLQNQIPPIPPRASYSRLEPDALAILLAITGGHLGQFKKRAIQKYRFRLGERGMARFEVVGRDTDRDLIRSLARRLAEDGPGAMRLRPGHK